MTAIYVDADACPVKQEVIRVAERHGLEVTFVANQYLRLGPAPGLRVVVVPEGADAADDWIAERIGPGDIAVTQDIPLAARCLAAGAQALGNTGKSFTDDNIGAALAMRDLKAHLRETTDHASGPPAFTKRDRSVFLQALENAVRGAKGG